LRRAGRGPALRRGPSESRRDWTSIAQFVPSLYPSGVISGARVVADVRASATSGWFDLGLSRQRSRVRV